MFVWTGCMHAYMLCMIPMHDTYGVYDVCMVCERERDRDIIDVYVYQYFVHVFTRAEGKRFLHVR